MNKLPTKDLIENLKHNENIVFQVHDYICGNDVFRVFSITALIKGKNKKNTKKTIFRSLEEDLSSDMKVYMNNDSFSQVSTYPEPVVEVFFGINPSFNMRANFIKNELI